MTDTPEQSRWTDSPFRQPGLSPEQLEWLDKRDEATRIFQECRSSAIMGHFESREIRGRLEVL